MIPPTAPSTTKVSAQGGSPATHVVVAWSSPAGCAGTATAKSGSIARMGMTAISWNSSTEKALWPPRVSSRSFSLRLWSTIAVDDRASVIPTARLVRQS